MKFFRIKSARQGLLALLFILTLTSPTYAALPSAISIIEQSISQQDGVYFYDKDTSGLYFTDLNVPDRNMDGNNPFAPNRIGISNDSLDYVVFDESVVVELYHHSNQEGAKIEIKYNEDTNEISCTYQYDSSGNLFSRDTIRTDDCNSSRVTSLGKYQISNESVYVLDLNQLCIWNRDGVGNCSHNIYSNGIWANEVSSFSITEVGQDVDVDFPLIVGEGAEFQTERVYLDLARRVSNFYNWAVSVGALLALAVIIYGGVLYSASAGNSSRIGEAKTWIQRAIFGLILLFSSYIILNTINPDLTKLEDAFLTKNVRIGTSGVELTGSGEAFGPIPVVGNTICQEDCIAGAQGSANTCNSLPSCKGLLVAPPNTEGPKLTFSAGQYKSEIDGAYYQMPLESEDGSYVIGLQPSDMCGQLDLIKVIYTVARRWQSRFPNDPIWVGDLNGRPHSSHDRGRDVDMNDRDFRATDYGGDTGKGTSSTFRKDMSIELGKLLMDTGKISSISFSDVEDPLHSSLGKPVIDAVNQYARENGLPGIMAPLRGHQDHFHIKINVPQGACSISCSELGDCNCNASYAGPTCS